jgi:hypothetical protein
MLRARVVKGDPRGVSIGRAKAALEILSRRLPRQWAQQVKHHVETVEDEFFEVLERVCNDPTVNERVCEKKDCGVLFASFCEALASREGDGEAETDPGARAESVH